MYVILIWTFFSGNGVGCGHSLCWNKEILDFRLMQEYIYLTIKTALNTCLSLHTFCTICPTFACVQLMSGHKGADKYAPDLNSIKLIFINIFVVRVVKFNRGEKKDRLTTLRMNAKPVFPKG